MAGTQSVWRDEVSLSDLFESRLMGEQGTKDQVFLAPDSVLHAQLITIHLYSLSFHSSLEQGAPYPLTPPHSLLPPPLTPYTLSPFLTPSALHGPPHSFTVLPIPNSSFLPPPSRTIPQAPQLSSILLNPPYFSHSSRTPYHLIPLQPITLCVLCILSQSSAILSQGSLSYVHTSPFSTLCTCPQHLPPSYTHHIHISHTSHTYPTFTLVLSLVHRRHPLRLPFVQWRFEFLPVLENLTSSLFFTFDPSFLHCFLLYLRISISLFPILDFSLRSPFTFSTPEVSAIWGWELVGLLLSALGWTSSRSGPEPLI